MGQQDPRDYQIIFLSLFLVLGIGTRDWTLRPELMLVLLLSCLLTQWVMVSFWGKFQENWSLVTSKLPVGWVSDRVTQQQQKFSHPISSLKNNFIPVSLKSAAITALSLCLLLRADHYITMVIAGTLAISSKFIFQVERKHFFNPANFGIIAALILTNDAWVSPGQWGDSGWYALLFAGSGCMILKLVGRWDTTAAFFGAYTLLEGIRNFWLGWTWDVFCHRLMSGSLLLFALFMLTDPRSIPNARMSRLVWAICIAVLTFILRNQLFVSTAVFWALFALAPLTVVLDLIWSSPRFNWSDAKSG
ncbi:MAG: Na+-transporting NADH:ubiquinone oxidoreductase, subunit NqrB [Symploca sp. SIO2C1]|nr:Na+-transporting NADH:ubiquinone oxidoreductase, subunit NqrB [Symploca sp. SIO2C1]